MADNRLEIRIAARTEQFERALKQLQANVKSSSAGIAKAFENAGDGVDVLDKAIGEIEGAFAKSTKEGEAALAGLQDKASKTGQDIREAFIKAGKSVDEAEQETEQFIKALRDFAKAKADIDQLGKSFEDVEKAAKGARNATDDLSKIQIAEKLSADVGAISSRFDEAGERARDLRRDIRLAFSNPKDAEKYIAAAEKLRDKYGELIDTADFGKAIKRLDNLGSASEENLERISKLALNAGRDLEDAADDIAEFLAPLDSGNADFALLDETLRANFGIAAKALQQYGAEVDSTGKLIARTRDQQLKAQEALRKYIDESDRFTNIAGRSKDAQDKLSDSVERFNRSVGDQVNEFKNSIAEGILPYIDDLNSLSDTTKAVIGITASSVSSLAGFGVKAVEVGAFASILGGNVVKATGAIKNMDKALIAARLSTLAMAGGIAIAVAGLALIAKTGYDAYKAIQDLEKAEKSLADTQRKALKDDRAKFIRQSVDAITQETDAIEDAGQRRAAITDAIIAKEAKAELLRQEGLREQAGRLQAEADALKRQREIYDADTAAVVKSEKEKTAARERAYQESIDAFTEFKLELQRGEFESSQAALSALQSISSGLSGDALKEANAERRKLQKDALQDQLNNLKQEVQERKKSADESKKIFANLVKEYEARGQDKVDLEREFTEFIKGENDKRFQQEQQIQARRIALKQQEIALLKSAANPELDTLEKRLQKGEDVEDQLKKEYAAEAQNLKILAEKEAAIQKLIIAREKEDAVRQANRDNNPEGAKAAAEFAAEAQKQVDTKLAQDKAAIDKKLADDREKLDDSYAKKKAARDAKSAEQTVQNLELERAKQEENFAARRRQLDEEERLGIDISQKRLDLEKEIQDFNRQVIDERLQAELEVIKAKRDAANVGASSSQQDLNNKQAELDIQQAILKSKQDTQAIDEQELTKAREKTSEIEKQIEAQKTLNDEKKKGFSIDSDFGDVSGLDNINSFGEGFGQRRGPKEEEGPTEQELQRQLARAKVEEIQAAERVKRGQSSPASDRTKAINEAERAKAANDSAASPQAPPKVELPPEVVGLFQQMVNALNQTAQNTARANQQQSQQQSFRNSDVAQNFTRGTGSTLYD